MARRMARKLPQEKVVQANVYKLRILSYTVPHILRLHMAKAKDKNKHTTAAATTNQLKKATGSHSKNSSRKAEQSIAKLKFKSPGQAT